MLELLLKVQSVKMGRAAVDSHVASVLKLLQTHVALKLGLDSALVLNVAQ